ncbi:UNVERIFIED_CONTAM: cytochrome [Sesamum radiatum]|uniref:Cytochrome n=1 Tax=Sesamum radiatum TaxID=300843 RepID=A0AAW2WMS1_SESRA
MNGIIFHPFLFQVLVSLLLFWAITKWLCKPAANKKLPPSPWKLPILGNLHQLGSLPHRNLQSLAKKHGPLMLLHFGKVPTLIVSSADAAREIMKTHDLIFADRPQSSVGRRLLYGFKDVVVAPYSEYWRQLKSICVLQLLGNKRVQSFHSIREEETALLVKKIRNSTYPVNLSEMFAELTNDVICRSAFGRKYSDGENSKKCLSLSTELLELMGSLPIGDFTPGLSWISRVNGFDARVDKFSKEMDEFLERVIRERMETPEKNKNGANFVDILLDIYQSNSAGVSIHRDSIKAIILDVYAGGTETTPTVLEWAMTELLGHPSVMKKLQTEVREIVKDKQDITDNDLEKMHYLKAVIKETLRSHTPLPLLVARVARKDVKIMGYDISAGTTVITNAWAISRDPVTWDEPEKFEPDRFLNSSIDFKGLDFELIPFGAGRRGCPGITFAMVTIEFVLANLVQKFDWKLPDEGKELDMKERPGITVHTDVPLLAAATQYHP